MEGAYNLLDMIGGYDTAEREEFEAFVWSLHQFVAEVLFGQREEDRG